jgi:hypothetical protein
MLSAKFREVAFWSITMVNALMCLVSYYTSKLGLDTTTELALVSVSVAFAGASFSFVLWFILSRRFPEADTKQKLRYLGIVLVFSFLLFGFSTQWSVITLGGREAVSIHMQTVLSESDKQGLRLLNQGSEEANLAPQFNALANQFKGYAEREARGAYSKLIGEGDVVATARNTAELFSGLALNVEEIERNRANEYEGLKEEISSARDVLTSDEPIRTVNLKFGKRLSEINEHLTRMAKMTSAKYVTAVNRNLSSLTMVVSEGATPDQRQAISQLQKMTSGAQKVVSRLMDQDAFAEAEVQTFTMISMSSAVMKYAGEIFYAWAYAIALDFAPFLFIILLSVAHGQEQREITLEEAEQVRFDADEYAQRILDEMRESAEHLISTTGEDVTRTVNTARESRRDVEQATEEVLSAARERVLEVIEECKPEITSAADAARENLEEAVVSTIGDIRQAVVDARRAVDEKGQEWIKKFQSSRFKV